MTNRDEANKLLCAIREVAQLLEIEPEAQDFQAYAPPPINDLSLQRRVSVDWYGTIRAEETARGGFSLHYHTYGLLPPVTMKRHAAIHLGLYGMPFAGFMYMGLSLWRQWPDATFEDAFVNEVCQRAEIALDNICTQDPPYTEDFVSAREGIKQIRAFSDQLLRRAAVAEAELDILEKGL